MNERFNPHFLHQQLFWLQWCFLSKHLGCVLWHLYVLLIIITFSFFVYILDTKANEYASYHNTMSRRSLFGSHYTHQPNISKYKYSYPSDVSLSSHYGYTSWGLWRDAGHLSPSVYSKKRINIRSFSILIMSAAFIVLLAVLSVAGLAFYFSTFKSDPSECKYLSATLINIHWS